MVCNVYLLYFSCRQGKQIKQKIDSIVLSSYRISQVDRFNCWRWGGIFQNNEVQRAQNLSFFHSIITGTHRNLSIPAPL